MEGPKAKGKEGRQDWVKERRILEGVEVLVREGGKKGLKEGLKEGGKDRGQSRRNRSENP